MRENKKFDKILFFEIASIQTRQRGPDQEEFTEL